MPENIQQPVAADRLEPLARRPLFVLIDVMEDVSKMTRHIMWSKRRG